ncbi:phosphotransferase [Shewanella goraebulensis]|uniref:phosphotransferase n=1 Tax=Shewanella goraebulensis TaxID=3050637 RepID=UPI00254F7066|nr:phosphotransferase [Shewanella goraebulensis]
MNTDAFEVNLQLLEQIKRQTRATDITHVELIQSLWSGYGELFRAHLSGSTYDSVIVKHIKLPVMDSNDNTAAQSHPKGWNTALSHQRKITSYQVEFNWYQEYANQCSHDNRVPECLYLKQNGDDCLLILEDLATVGFSKVLSCADDVAIKACLKWLGQFHGQFLFQNPATKPLQQHTDTINQNSNHCSKDSRKVSNHLHTKLWQQGTYWHLNTRPDELAVLTDLRLKAAAQQIDTALSNSPFQTLVHGDAKLANFCFTENHQQAAAVDFQYVGQGCGMKDVALLLSSVMTFSEDEAQITQWLNYYFSELVISTKHHQPHICTDKLVQTWRPLYSIAWADFQRFVKGWSPNHFKINPYTEALTAKALEQLKELGVSRR